MRRKLKALVKCELCPLELASMQSLKHHMEAIHLGKKSNQCEICYASFVSKSKVKLHVTAVHE